MSWNLLIEVRNYWSHLIVAPLKDLDLGIKEATEIELESEKEMEAKAINMRYVLSHIQNNKHPQR